MFLFTGTQTIILFVVIGVLLVVFSILIFLYFKVFKKKVVVDNEYIGNIVSILGNIENVNEVSVENNRLRFTIVDLDLVNFEGLKELCSNGVFITGNVVKCLFKIESSTIAREIKQRIGEKHAK